MLYLAALCRTFLRMEKMGSRELSTALLAHRAAFKGFLVSRMGNEADAEDLLQNGLVKAIDHAGEIQDGEKAVAWFYRVLRNSVIDHQRSRHAAARRDDAWASHALAEDDRDVRRELCGCFEKLLPTLKPTHAELIRRVELRDEPVSKVAGELGLTANHASVALHRARAELRGKLRSFCGDCACLDNCECD